MNTEVKRAFVLRIYPSGVNKVPDALEHDQIIIGWSRAAGLISENLSWHKFRSIVSETYYSNEMNLRKAGSAAGHLWRFINDFKVGDLVVVPYGSNFYVAQILGTPTYDATRLADDTAYRRNVKWLNNKQPIPRALARSALVSRMKSQGTCVDATDLLPLIEECLSVCKKDETPSFNKDLQSRLVKETLDEIRSGRMDSFRFEHFIKDIMLGLGAVDAYVVPRNKDTGADILATFNIAGTIRQVVAIQAKHWQPEPPVGKEVVEQLIRGIEAESANLGMVVTSGTISDEAALAAEEYFEEKGIKIELVDGEQFSKLIVEYGIKHS